MGASISALEAKVLMHGPGEVAVLDVSEHGQYGEGHPFLAVPCPYSRLELLAPRLVPRRFVPVLLIDAGDGVSERAAARLVALGYTDVRLIEGGAPAWQAAGFTLFKGVNVPSKTLGELVEETWHVPRVGPADLDAWTENGRAFRLFDGRPASEFAKMTIPGSRCLPNGELAHRFACVVADKTTPIIVNCAGRTRSIIGAAGLKLAGVPNPVFALENGTQGWALSGRTLRYCASCDPFPALDESASADSRQRGRRLAERHGISRVSVAEIGALAADPTRTVYLFDVRTAEEYAARSADGAVHAPGGQLIQVTDQWIGVRRARVILADDTGLRATLAAVWLLQLGYEVYVLSDIADVPPGWSLRCAHGIDAPARPALPRIAAEAAVSLVAQGGQLVDLRGSVDYRAGHLAAARWGIRPRLKQLGLEGRKPICLIGPREIVELAAEDLRELGARDLRHVDGSLEKWREAGLACVSTPEGPSDEDAIDYLFFVHDRHDGNLEAARRYLAWETGLTRQLDAAEHAELKLAAMPLDDHRL